MSLVSDIIENAYNVAGIVTPISGTVTAAQSTLGLSQLNEIIAAKRKMSWFAVQPYQVDFDLSTNKLFIGETVTSGDPNVTVINQQFFSSITQAAIILQAGGNPIRYAIDIQMRGQLDNINYLVTRTGRPKTLWYQNRLDSSNNYFTDIFINPINSIYDLEIYGMPGAVDFSGTTDTILNGLEEYLKYELAKNLCEIHNSVDRDWGPNKQASHRQAMIDLQDNNVIDLTPRSTNRLSRYGSLFDLSQL